jgi:uncharacterized protein (UPF0276 family)
MKLHRDQRPIQAAPISPIGAGAGLKADHADEIFSGGRRVDFFEIHAENYMGAGGPPHRLLERIRADYTLSIHGVGASIGGGASLDPDHLGRLKHLVRTYQPALFSEHLAWSTHDGVFLNDLLPLPYTGQTLDTVCDHIDELQDTVGMRMLLENPTAYVAFETSTMSETDFLRAVARRTGCGLLLDVNNVHVSSINRACDAYAYIDAFPAEFVEEIHLAGFAEDCDGEGRRLLIDDHGRPVGDAVWQLYRYTLGRTGRRPTLIEWDNNVPAFGGLAAEVARVRRELGGYSHRFDTLAAA